MAANSVQFSSVQFIINLYQLILQKNTRQLLDNGLNSTIEVLYLCANIYHRFSIIFNYVLTVNELP